jgi:hypothetical protein
MSMRAYDEALEVLLLLPPGARVEGIAGAGRIGG